VIPYEQIVRKGSIQCESVYKKQTGFACFGSPRPHESVHRVHTIRNYIKIRLIDFSVAACTNGESIKICSLRITLGDDATRIERYTRKSGVPNTVFWSLAGLNPIIQTSITTGSFQ